METFYKHIKGELIDELFSAPPPLVFLESNAKDVEVNEYIYLLGKMSRNGHQNPGILI